LIATVTDLLIDSYIAFRFILYIKNARSIHNEQHILLPFNSLSILWDTLRIMISSIQNISIIILSQISHSTIGYTILTINFISLSYVITFDLGKSDNSTNEVELESDIERKISDNISETSTSIVLRVSNEILPLKIVHDEIKMEQQYNIEMLEQTSILEFYNLRHFMKQHQWF